MKNLIDLNHLLNGDCGKTWSKTKILKREEKQKQ